MYKAALKSGLYDFTSARDFYREATKSAGIGMHHDLVKRYVSLQALMLTPIAPHWAEYMWIDVLGNTTSIQHERFPTVPDQVASLTAAREYVRATSSNITSAEGAQQKKIAKGKAAKYDPKAPKKLTIYAAQAFPAWQDKCIELVREAFDGVTLDAKALSQKFDKAETKKAMPFVNNLKRRLESGEKQTDVFERKLLFDELNVLTEMVPGLQQTVQKCAVVEIVSIKEGATKGIVVGGSDASAGEERTDLPPQAETAVPGAPTFNFENVSV